MKPKANTRLSAKIEEIARAVLKEAGPDAMRVDWDIMKQQVENEIRDFTMDMAQELVYQSRTRMLKSIAMFINQHNMTDTTYGRLDGPTLETLMDQMDEDAVQDISMEAASDIEDALADYAQKLGQFAVHVVSSSER